MYVDYNKFFTTMSISMEYIYLGYLYRFIWIEEDSDVRKTPEIYH